MRFIIFYIICFSSLISVFPKIEVFGFSHTSLGWIIPFLLSILTLIYMIKVKLRFPIHIWFIWILFIVYSLSFFLAINTLQRAIMLLCPILIGVLFGSLDFKKSDLKRITKALVFLTYSIFLVRILSFLLKVEINSPGIVMIAVLLICYFSLIGIDINRKYFFYVFLSVLIPIIGINRMAILAGLSSFAVALHKISLIKKVLLIGFIFLLGLVVFNSSKFQEKMFYSGSGELSTFIENPEDIRTHGRLVMWIPMWEEIKKSPIFGYGFDQSTPFIKRYIPWIMHPHNDYLRIVFELGIFGFVIFLFTHCFQIYDLIIRYRESTGLSKMFFLIGAYSFIPFFFLMITGNPIYYVNYFGNLQFALIGIAYSLYRNENSIYTQ